MKKYPHADWGAVVKKYPDIEAVLEDVPRTQMVLLDKIHDLDEHYPVEGFEWDCDPNEIGSGQNTWGLVSTQVHQDAIARTDAALAKQRVCVQGTHHFQSMNGLLWCKYCGTIIYGDKTFYPEQPHFLPKNNNS